MVYPSGEHAYGVVELFPGQFAVWISLPHEVKQSLFGPFFTRDSRDYLLGENIERFLGDNQMVQLAAPGGVNQRGAFDEFVTARREQSALRNPPTEWPDLPTRWSKVAIDRVEPNWHTRSTAPMSIPSSSEAVATRAAIRRPLSVVRRQSGVRATSCHDVT